MVERWQAVQLRARDARDGGCPVSADRAATADEVAIAKRILKDEGYVVLKAKSHHLAQMRLQIAQRLADDAREQAASQDLWWREHILPELFSYRDRVTFLYGAARAAGCTVDELRGTER